MIRPALLPDDPADDDDGPAATWLEPGTDDVVDEDDTLELDEVTDDDDDDSVVVVSSVVGTVTALVDGPPLGGCTLLGGGYCTGAGWFGVTLKSVCAVDGLPEASL